MSSIELKIDWCSHEAAEFAVKNWHYSRTMPKSKLAKFGVWENKKFIGAVIYGCGATRALVKSYGLHPTEGCELVRVALTKHDSQVSKILSITLRLLRKKYPKLKLVVSFADPNEGHHGGIYQASNWIFTGRTTSSDEYVFKGKRWHGRAFRLSHGSHKNYLDKGLKIKKGSSKYRYIFILDQSLREKIEKQAKQYPKRAQSKESVAPANHAGESGANPTSAHNEKAA